MDTLESVSIARHVRFTISTTQATAFIDVTIASRRSSRWPACAQAW